MQHFQNQNISIYFYKNPNEYLTRGSVVYFYGYGDNVNNQNWIVHELHNLDFDVILVENHYTNRLLTLNELANLAPNNLVANELLKFFKENELESIRIKNDYLINVLFNTIYFAEIKNQVINLGANNESWMTCGFSMGADTCGLINCFYELDKNIMFNGSLDIKGWYLKKFMELTMQFLTPEESKLMAYLNTINYLEFFSNSSTLLINGAFDEIKLARDNQEIIKKVFEKYPKSNIKHFIDHYGAHEITFNSLEELKKYINN